MVSLRITEDDSKKWTIRKTKRRISQPGTFRKTFLVPGQSEEDVIAHSSKQDIFTIPLPVLGKSLNDSFVIRPFTRCA
jgi:hypothetical protein